MKSIEIGIHHGENVYIPSIQSSDSGSYECIASNTIHASISRSFYLTVQCKSILDEKKNK